MFRTLSVRGGPSPRAHSPLLALFLLAAGAQAQGEGNDDVFVPPGLIPSALDAIVGCDPSDPSCGPEDELNCLEVRFAASGVRAIVPNLPARGAEFARASRVFAKALYEAVALQEGTTLHAQLEAGVVSGIEFDWFFPEPLPGAPILHAPDPVDVHLLDGTLVARVYGYEAAAYEVKKAMVEAMVGHPMASHLVYEEDTLQVPMDGLPLVVRGSRNAVHGPLFVGPGAELSGSGNRLFGPLYTFGPVESKRGNEAFDVVAAERSGGARLPGVDTLRRFAIVRGTYYPGDVVLDVHNAPSTGLVFAEGTIALASGVRGALTLVSASGHVSIRGDGVSLVPAAAGVLAVSFSGDVVVTGSSSRLVGTLHAPGGSLDLAGRENRLLGTFAGQGVELSGSGNVLTDGTEVVDP